jgi:hypothetical protein
MDKSDLSKYCKVGLACIAGAAGIYGLEQTGIPQVFYDYEVAKTALAVQFYGDFWGSLNRFGAPESARFGIDAVAFVTSAILTYSGLEAISDKINERKYNREIRKKLKL